MISRQHLPSNISELYEVHDYHHASAIFAVEFPEEFAELMGMLSSFRIRVEDLTAAGGNESNIPKMVASMLRPLGWQENNLRAVMLVDGKEMHSDTHKVDFLKGRIAFDLEWNSKDQTFDRDLFAFRTFHEYGRISLGVLLTRSAELNDVFKMLGIQAKYGASTTWMGKLLPRLEAGRGGGCPVLVLGITPRIIADLELNQEPR